MLKTSPPSKNYKNPPPPSNVGSKYRPNQQTFPSNEQTYSPLVENKESKHMNPPRHHQYPINHSKSPPETKTFKQDKEPPEGRSDQLPRGSPSSSHAPPPTRRGPRKAEMENERNKSNICIPRGAQTNIITQTKCESHRRPRNPFLCRRTILETIKSFSISD